MTITAGTPLAGASSGLFAATDFASLAGTAWLEGVAACSWEFLIRASARGHVMTIREAGSGNHRMSVVQMAAGNIASATNCWRAYITTATGFRAVESAASTAPLDTLQHIAVTYASGSLKLYINGAQDSTSTAGTGTGNVKTDGKPLRIGEPVDSAGGGFAGRLSRFWFYTRELSAVEIAASARAKLDWAGFVGVGAEDAATDATAGPVAAPYRANVTAQADLDVLAKAYDPDGALSLTAAGPGVSATVARQGTLVRVTPPTGSGLYSAPYTISDGTKSASSKIFGSYSPSGGDDGGVAGVDDVFDAFTNLEIEVDPLANDTGKPDEITALSTPTNGTATLTADKKRVKYKSGATFTGTATFTHIPKRASDGASALAPSTVTMRVAAGNPASARWASGLGNGNDSWATYNTQIGRAVTANAGWHSKGCQDSWGATDGSADGKHPTTGKPVNLFKSSGASNFWGGVNTLKGTAIHAWMIPYLPAIAGVDNSFNANPGIWAKLKVGGTLADTWKTRNKRFGFNLAKTCTEAGVGDSLSHKIVIVAGHECTGEGYNWIVGSDHANYVLAFQAFYNQVHEGAEEYSTGWTNFKIEQRVVNKKAYGATFAKAYPGDDYVDILAISLHENTIGPSSDAYKLGWANQSEWDFEMRPPAGSATGGCGFMDLVDHAVLKGKPIGVDEWDTCCVEDDAGSYGVRQPTKDAGISAGRVRDLFQGLALNGRLHHEMYLTGIQDMFRTNTNATKLLAVYKKGWDFDGNNDA